MPPAGERNTIERDYQRLLSTLEQLLAVDATETSVALTRCSDLVGHALGAGKVDIFVYDSADDALVVKSASDSPLSRLQLEVGLGTQPLSDGGRMARVFMTGDPWFSNHVDQDPEELASVVGDLGIRSTIAVPLIVDGRRRGVVAASSDLPGFFTHDDLTFLEAVSHWVGLILHRTELVERTARDTAEQARRHAAEELITILAHDLRIPLTPLGGRINMLQLRAEREAHEANRRDAIAMQHAVEHLDQIIGDLLDTSRLEQGIFELDPKETDLVTLIRQSIATMEDPGFAIELSAPPQLMAMIDPARIRQVLENLLNNARVHARSTHPIQLVISLESGDDGDWALLSVRDFGPGIPSNLLPRIFSRFSFGRDSRGLGLGLYLARGITVAHGGTLTVESELGHGSTFHLRLPTTSRS